MRSIPSVEGNALTRTPQSAGHPRLPERKGSSAGLGFRRILGHKNVLAIEIDGRYSVLDRDGIMLEIDGIPFQANRLAAAQAVERTEKNRDFQFGSL
jgi:hypothetical protein